MTNFAAAILAAMDALDIDQAHICGLSLGGVVAIAMHHAAPERCASLIIADSFAAHPDGRGIFNRSVKASRAMTMRELAEERAEMLLAPNAADALRDEVVATMSDDQSRRLSHRRARGVAGRPARAARCHRRAGTGHRRRPGPHHSADAVARPRQPNRRRQSWSKSHGAGHLPNIERPAAFNAAVDQFLAEIAQKTKRYRVFNLAA